MATLPAKRSFLAFILIPFVILISGCAGRRPVVGSQPPPMTPTPTPASTEESAKASTAAEAPTAPVVKPGKPADATAPVAGRYVEEGNASWYGVPFHGRRASNVEVHGGAHYGRRTVRGQPDHRLVLSGGAGIGCGRPGSDSGAARSALRRRSFLRILHGAGRRIQGSEERGPFARPLKHAVFARLYPADGFG